MLKWFEYRQEIPNIPNAIDGTLLVITSFNHQPITYDMQSKLIADTFRSILMINNGKMSVDLIRNQLMKYNATQYHILYRPPKNLGYQCSQRVALSETWPVVQRFERMIFFSAPDVYPFPPLLTRLSNALRQASRRECTFLADPWYKNGYVADIFILTRPDKFKMEWWKGRGTCTNSNVFEIFLKNMTARHRLSHETLGMMKSYHLSLIHI